MLEPAPVNRLFSCLGGGRKKAADGMSDDEDEDFKEGSC